MNPTDASARLFVAVDRAIWRGQKINRRNVARAWCRVECAAIRYGYADVRRMARALADMHREIADGGR